MKRLIVLAMAACIAAPASAVSPIADIHCAPRDEIRRTLETRLGAVRQGSSMCAPEAIMAIWRNPASGEWTLVQT